jgi:hypothetical protein
MEHDLGHRGLDNEMTNDVTINRIVVATTIDETTAMTEIVVPDLSNLRQHLPPTQFNLRTIFRLLNNSKHPRLLLANRTQTNVRTNIKRWPR